MDDYVETVEVVRDARRPQADREQAYSVLVRQFRPMVYSCAMGRLGDSSQAEDVAQDTLLAAWQNIKQLREPARFPGWLRRIALWRCQYYTAKDVQSTSVDELIEHLPSKDDPAASLERGELIDQVRQVLWRLPRHHREILILHYLDQYSQREIAGFLDLTEGTVRKRLHDARQRTRRLYDRWLREAVGAITPTDKDWRRRMIRESRDKDGRTAQDKIDGMRGSHKEYAQFKGKSQHLRRILEIRALGFLRPPT